MAKNGHFWGVPDPPQKPPKIVKNAILGGPEKVDFRPTKNAIFGDLELRLRSCPEAWHFSAHLASNPLIKMSPS